MNAEGQERDVPEPTRSPWHGGERYERTPSLLLRQEEYDESYEL